MFLILTFLLIPISYAAFPPPDRSTPLFPGYRVAVESVGRFSNVRPIAVRAILSVKKMRRIRNVTFRSFTSTLILHKQNDAHSDVVGATEDTTDTEAMTRTDSDIEASASIEENTSSAMQTLKSVPPNLQPSATTTLSSTQLKPITSSVLPYRTSLPALGSAQLSPPQRTRLHRGVIPILVCSAVGAASLVLVTVLAVCVCRRMRARASLHKGIGANRWFNTDEKEDFAVSIYVPPHPIPLKGILLPSSTLTSHSPNELHADRVSLTSSQLSVIINNLPKAHISRFDTEPLRVGGHDSSIPATRIGPSPSDFFTSIFGQSHSFASSNLCSSRILSAPAQLLPCHLKVPLAQHRGGFKGPFSTHTPTLPQTAVSPSLGVSSGPRGHGFVLTGDQSSSPRSFAQWCYQRSLAQDRDGNVPRFVHC